MHIRNICCIGGGYVGGPTMAVMALKCPDIQVNVVDINKDRIDNWNDKNLSKLPVYEPGLAEIVKECRGKNLHFSTKVKEMIEIADMIFISVNTPTKTKGLGAGKASDLKWVENSAREVATFSKGHTIVIEKSTLPVRTAEVIQLILNSSQNQTNPDYENKMPIKEKPGSDLNDATSQEKRSRNKRRQSIKMVQLNNENARCTYKIRSKRSMKIIFGIILLLFIAFIIIASIAASKFIEETPIAFVFILFQFAQES